MTIRVIMKLGEPKIVIARSAELTLKYGGEWLVITDESGRRTAVRRIEVERIELLE